MYRVDETVAVLNEILAERSEQLALWGEQGHDDLRWHAILTEEVGEVAKELCGFFESVQSGRSTVAVSLHLARLKRELIQVAAVAVAWIENLNRLTGSSSTGRAPECGSGDGGSSPPTPTAI